MRCPSLLARSRTAYRQAPQFPETESQSASSSEDYEVGESTYNACKGQPGNDEQLWRVIKGAGTTGGVLLALEILWRAHDRHPPGADETNPGSLIGWLGALGAALLFGTVWVPYGLQSAERSDPRLRVFYIIAYGSLGGGITTGLATVIFGWLGLTRLQLGTPQFMCGLLGAISVNMANLMAYLASRYAGVSVSPVLLASGAIITSYAWGVCAFSEPINDLHMSAFGLLALIVGAVTCTAAQTQVPVSCWQVVAHKRKAKAVLDPEHADARCRVSCSSRVFLILGCCIAMLGGVIDGSMLVPYKIFELRSLGQSEKHDQTELVQAAINETSEMNETLYPMRKAIKKRVVRFNATIHKVIEPMKPVVSPVVKPVVKKVVKPVVHAISLKVKHRPRSYIYLQGFAAAQLVLSSIMISALKMAELCDEGGALKKTGQACWLPGLLGGVFWASGNISSIQGAEYLGVAVGFPLTQSNIAVAAFYAAVLFGEMPHTAQRVVCALGISVQLLGSFCLALFA